MSPNIHVSSGITSVLPSGSEQPNVNHFWSIYDQRIWLGFERISCTGANFGHSELDYGTLPDFDMSIIVVYKETVEKLAEWKQEGKRRGAVPWREVRKSNLLDLCTNTGTKRQGKNTHKKNLGVAAILVAFQSFCSSSGSIKRFLAFSCHFPIFSRDQYTPIPFTFSLKLFFFLVNDRVQLSHRSSVSIRNIETLLPFDVVGPHVVRACPFWANPCLKPLDAARTVAS